MKLDLEAGCIDLLKWRCDLDPGLDFAALTLRLRERGFRAAVFDEHLVVLDGEDGVQLVLVPRTGRVQIRVGLLTPKSRRLQVARDVLETLERACESRPG